MHRLIQADHDLARWLNASVQRSDVAARLVAVGARRLPAIQIALMVVLGIGGKPRAALRMLLAVSCVYVAVEAIGRTWRRRRPFERLEPVRELVPHEPRRSFPSRHVASATAMAVVAAPASAPIARIMALLAGGLAVCRVGAGLHYPIDALAGVALGMAVGRAFRGR